MCTSVGRHGGIFSGELSGTSGQQSEFFGLISGLTVVYARGACDKVAVHKIELISGEEKA